MIGKLFANWRFRTTTPTFAPGEEIRAYLTGFDAATGEGAVRIGDTELKVASASATQLDQLVGLQIEHFDAASATGQARLLT